MAVVWAGGVLNRSDGIHQMKRYNLLQEVRMNVVPLSIDARDKPSASLQQPRKKKDY